MLNKLTSRVQYGLHHVDHTIGRHQVVVRHIEGIDLDGVVNLNKNVDGEGLG